MDKKRNVYVQTTEKETDEMIGAIKDDICNCSFHVKQCEAGYKYWEAEIIHVTDEEINVYRGFMKRFPSIVEAAQALEEFRNYIDLYDVYFI